MSQAPPAQRATLPGERPSDPDGLQNALYAGWTSLREALHAEWTKLRTLPGTIWLLAGIIAATVAVSTDLRTREGTAEAPAWRSSANSPATGYSSASSL